MLSGIAMFVSERKALLQWRRLQASSGGAAGPLCAATRSDAHVFASWLVLP
jgi:hypothetical protein